MQTFKMKNYTMEYHRGEYTLTADEGYMLRTADGRECKTVTTRDYTQWRAVEREVAEIEEEIATQPKRKRTRRAVNPER